MTARLPELATHECMSIKVSRDFDYHYVTPEDKDFHHVALRSYYLKMKAKKTKKEEDLEAMKAEEARQAANEKF